MDCMKSVSSGWHWALKGYCILKEEIAPDGWHTTVAALFDVTSTFLSPCTKALNKLPVACSNDEVPVCGI
jgi:hypothetical protein